MITYKLGLVKFIKDEYIFYNKVSLNCFSQNLCSASNFCFQEEKKNKNGLNYELRLVLIKF